MHIVKSVGVMSIARIMGLVYGCVGLIFAPFFLLIGLAGSLAGRDAPFAGIFGVVFAILMPLLYGGLGFISGAIGAWLYNVFAKWAGGFEVELELQQTGPASPYPLVPPPTPSI